jgi:hypothetical protein
MTVLITLTLAGSDVGPFNLYSNVDAYATPFATGISKATLLAGYLSSAVPNGTLTILVRSTGVCNRDLYLTVQGYPTTTTTTSSSTTTTTTSTSTSTTTTTTTAVPCTSYYNNTASTYVVNYIDCLGGPEVVGFSLTPGQGLCVRSISGDYGYLLNLGDCTA